MKLIRTIHALRAELKTCRNRGDSIGLVPTMGAFHDGHISLMQRARSQCDAVVVSLFVNPTQFNQAADLDRYPRNEARDAAMAESAGVDVLFAPDPAEIYPPGFATVVEVTGITEVLEGASRGAGHFRGVTTVVSKLLNIVQPDVAYFGQKDAQQALVVQRMARDLDFPVRIEVCPTVREPDGVAMSSRNALLDDPSRLRAPALYRALTSAERAVAAGEHDPERVIAAAGAELLASGVTPEYVAIVSTDTLAPVRSIHGEALMAVAATLGGVRLIDNVILHTR